MALLFIVKMFSIYLVMGEGGKDSNSKSAEASLVDHKVVLWSASPVITPTKYSML